MLDSQHGKKARKQVCNQSLSSLTSTLSLNSRFSMLKTLQTHYSPYCGEFRVYATCKRSTIPKKRCKGSIYCGCARNESHVVTSHHLFFMTATAPIIQILQFYVLQYLNSLYREFESHWLRIACFRVTRTWSSHEKCDISLIWLILPVPNALLSPVHTMFHSSCYLSTYLNILAT